MPTPGSYHPDGSDAERLGDAIQTARTLVDIARRTAKQTQLAHQEAELALERATSVLRMLTEVQERRAPSDPAETPDS